MEIYKNTYGFTLIETLIGILMTTVICSTLFLGITQAKLYLEAIRVKEKAFIELKNFTNEWKSMVAAGVSNFPSDSNSGEKVPLKIDSNGNTTLEGNLYKKITGNKIGFMEAFISSPQYETTLVFILGLALEAM